MRGLQLVDRWISRPRDPFNGLPAYPSAQGPTPPPVVCVRAANVRALAYAHGHVCAHMRVGVGVRVRVRRKYPFISK